MSGKGPEKSHQERIYSGDPNLTEQYFPGRLPLIVKATILNTKLAILDPMLDAVSNWLINWREKPLSFGERVIARKANQAYYNFRAKEMITLRSIQT